MTASPARPGKLSAALAAALLVALLAPSFASAAKADGSAKIKAQPGKAKTNLFKKGAKLRGPGKGRANRADLSVVSIAFGDVVRVKTRGAIKFQRGKRSVVVGGLVFKLRARNTVVAGKVGRKQVNLFRAHGKRLDLANTVALDKAGLALTRAGAKALGPKLGIERLRPGRLGELTLNAVQNDIAPRPQQPEQPKPHQPDPYPYAAQCPVSAVKGPTFSEPPTPVPPPTPNPVLGELAQDVVGTTIEWGFLESFRNYVLNVPPQGSLQTLDGATASASGPAMAAPHAHFGFPVGSGAYEHSGTPDRAYDRLIANAGGTVLFCKPGHGFAYAIRNPTVVIDAKASRLVAEVGTNQHGVWHDFQRTDIADLDMNGADITVEDGGNTVVWSGVTPVLTPEGEAALGAIYEAGEPLDKLTVRTSLNRPLLADCGVDSGIGAPTSVDFTLDPLPTLDEPVVVDGEGDAVGTINWGFRPSTRATVAAPGGKFLTYGGATEGFPGDMGGISNKPVSEGGGKGKFFRFPIASYEYDAGTADPSDDRLIAHSEASVGLCKPQTSSGNYGVILSKPTLIIDGESSRIVANAYSFAGPFGTGPARGWAGGRVELVDLDTSGVEAIVGSGTVTWGDVTEDGVPLEDGIPVAGPLKTEVLSLANLTIDATEDLAKWDPVAVQIEAPTP